MRVTFVYPDFFAFDDEHFMTEGRIYLGIGYLSAYLKRKGHSTSLLHLVRPTGREEFEARLAATRPDLVAFSSTTHLFPHVRKWAGWARESFPGTPLVCGGAHTTIDPEGALLSSVLDLVCLGEGEEALAELCAALSEGRDHHHIDSFWARNGEEVIRNPVRPLVEDLDSLPLPDREIFDPADFCDQQHERGTLMASRGCPYNCSYCSNHVQKAVYPNPEKYVRFRSVDNVMREVHADNRGRYRRTAEVYPLRRRHPHPRPRSGSGSWRSATAAKWTCPSSAIAAPTSWMRRRPASSPERAAALSAWASRAAISACAGRYSTALCRRSASCGPSTSAASWA